MKHFNYKSHSKKSRGAIPFLDLLFFKSFRAQSEKDWII